MVATAASIAFTTVGPPFDSACLPLGWDSAFSPRRYPSGYGITYLPNNVMGTITETVATCC
jgi:hypothetical protein